MAVTFNISAGFGSLLLRFLIMTFSVIVLMLLSQYSIDYSMRDIKSDSQLIHSISDQQKLTLQISRQITSNRLEGKRIRVPVDSLLNQLMHIQYYTLATGIKNKKSFSQHYGKLSNACHSFYTAVQKEMNAGDMTGYLNLLNYQQSYLEELAGFTVMLNEYSNARIGRFETMQQFIMVGTVISIALGAVFIFLPAMKRIKRQNESLQSIAYNQSHIVRRPLANIKLFLHLMYLSTEEEKEEMLELIRIEADQLDDIICRSVKQAEYYARPHPTSRLQAP